MGVPGERSSLTPLDRVAVKAERDRLAGLADAQTARLGKMGLGELLAAVAPPAVALGTEVMMGMGWLSGGNKSSGNDSQNTTNDHARKAADRAAQEASERIRAGKDATAGP